MLGWLELIGLQQQSQDDQPQVIKELLFMQQTMVPLKQVVLLALPTLQLLHRFPLLLPPLAATS